VTGDFDHHDATIPGPLATELNRLHAPTPRVPEAVDRRVLDLARERLKRSGTRESGTRWRIGAVLAAAAGVALAASAWLVVRGSGASGTGGRGTLAGDIDGSGRVDILDAFTLARAIEAGATLRSQWDLTGDGRVDDADVDRIAMTSVQLGGGA